MAGADAMAYLEEATIDGFVTLADLELEIQWAIDFAGLEDWLWDSFDGEFGNLEEQEMDEIRDALEDIYSTLGDLMIDQVDTAFDVMDLEMEVFENYWELKSAIAGEDETVDEDVTVDEA